MTRNRSIIFLAACAVTGLGLALVFLMGVPAVAETFPAFGTNSPANEGVAERLQYKGRVTQAGGGRIVLEDSRVLTHAINPQDGGAFRVFTVSKDSLVTDARGNAVALETLEPLTWALVEIDVGDGDETYPVALRVCAIDLQTHLDAIEPDPTE